MEQEARNWIGRRVRKEGATTLCQVFIQSKRRMRCCSTARIEAEENAMKGPKAAAAAVLVDGSRVEEAFFPVTIFAVLPMSVVKIHSGVNSALFSPVATAPAGLLDQTCFHFRRKERPKVEQSNLYLLREPKAFFLKVPTHLPRSAPLSAKRKATSLGGLAIVSRRRSKSYTNYCNDRQAEELNAI